MKSKKLVLVTGVLLALLITACKVNFITTIEKNGAGTYVQEIGFQGDEASMAGLNAGDENFCAAQSQELPPNTSIHQETRDEDEIWCVYESPFESLDALQTIYGMTDTRINDISLVDGKLTYDISLDLSGDSGAPMGAEISWIVTMPGKVVETNATQQDGNSLTWSLVGGKVNNIRAVSNVGGLNLGDGTLLYVLGGMVLVCVCCLLPIVIAGIVIFILRKRNAASPEEPQSPAQA